MVTLHPRYNNILYVTRKHLKYHDLIRKEDGENGESDNLKQIRGFRARL